MRWYTRSLKRSSQEVFSFKFWASEWFLKLPLRNIKHKFATLMQLLLMYPNLWLIHWCFRALDVILQTSFLSFLFFTLTIISYSFPVSVDYIIYLLYRHPPTEKRFYLVSRWGFPCSGLPCWLPNPPTFQALTFKHISSFRFSMMALRAFQHFKRFSIYITV